MNTYTKKLLFAFIFCLSIISVKAQLPYSEDFDTGGPCNTNFPANWTTASTTSDWLIDASDACGGGVPQCTVAGSSGGSVLAGADGSGNLESTVSASVSTVGFTNIIVDWNGFRSTAAPTTTLEYSFDDVTYTVVAFTDVATDDNWHPVTTVSLPTDCDNVPVLYLRWSYNSTAAGAFVAFDDLLVNGTALNVFYWNGGAPHLTTSWGVNLDGTGPNPVNFTTSSQTFNFYNNTGTNFAPTLSANWAVSGGSCFINVGDGSTRLTNFTIPSGFSLSITGTTLSVANGGTLTLANTVMPPANLVTLNNGSTVNYAQSAIVTMYNKAYSNLTISGTANKNHGGAATSVSGILNIATSSANYVMSPSTLITFTISGTVAGSGSILTGNSNLVISGTGNLGTLRFGVGSTSRQIRNLTINRTSSGIVTLGSELRVGGSAVFTNGVVNLNGNTLGCNGAITFPVSTTNGSFGGSTVSSFTVGGTGAISNNLHMDQTSAATRAMNNVWLQRTGATMTIDNPIEIWGAITASVGTIATGSGNLTIKSSATAKGRVGQMGASGDLTGSNITVEIFTASGFTGYTNLGSPGLSALTFAAWDDDIAITCPTCPDGSMVSSTPFTSVTSYDETAFSGDFGNAAHYVDIANVTDAMGTGKGWWLYLGDGNVSTSSIILDATGSINKGNLANIPLTVTGGASAQNGWNLLANPYPAPISFTAVINGNTANCENALYVWNPDLNGGNGDFAVFTPSVGSVPSVGSGGVDDNIPTGQGFYIRATSAFNLSPVEAWKSATTGTVNPLLKSNSVAYPASMFILNLTGGGPKNFNTMTAINLNPNATAGFDNNWDAHHLSPGYGIAEIFSSSGADMFKMNSIPTINGSVTIPVTVRSGYSGSYQIAPLNLNNLPAGACVSLYDKFTNTTHDLKAGPYTFNFIDTTNVSRFNLTITVNQTTVTSSATNPACIKTPNGKIIATGTTSGPWNYRWKDQNNVIIKTTNNVSTPDTLKNIGAGTYYVDVNTVNTCDNANASFNITVTNPLPVAAYDISKESESGTAFCTFFNNSSNASQYTWDFGDGNTANSYNANHTYTIPGEYLVTLHAVNPTCADSSTYRAYVTVEDGLSTGAAASPTLSGVASIDGSDNTIKISKDINGVYVEFNFDKSTKATVSVTNVLGQTLTAPRAIEGITQRFYIDVNTKDQVLLITVTTAEKRVTQRLLNN
jgi:PKD repeat protein